MKTGILLLRTPFQAWLAKQVLKHENVQEYDILYFTQNNSEEDQYYYSLVSKSAKNAKYFYSPIRKYDIIGQLYFLWQARHYMKDLSRDLVLMASIDSIVISAVMQKQSSVLVSFDDGTGNYNTTSIYHVETSSSRVRLYRIMLGVLNLEQIKRRISRHYTLYPDLPNIVDKKRLHTLDGWSDTRTKFAEAKEKMYFIGQPFEENLSREHIIRLTEIMSTFNIDYYVRHPRERSVLDIGVPLLDKRGLIAEDAIISNAGDSPIHIIGWFSSVIFNLAPIASKRTMFLFADDPKMQSMYDLANRSGCEIIVL